MFEENLWTIVLDKGPFIIKTNRELPTIFMTPNIGLEID